MEDDIFVLDRIGSGEFADAIIMGRLFGFGSFSFLKYKEADED